MRIAVSRAPGAQRAVSPLELFFDLVYVFAIGQLSLLEHVDLRTGAETVIMALAVFYAWYMTAWGANWLEPDRLPVRVLLVALMFASLLMSVAIGEAFDERAWLFVTGYLLLQVGRSAFLIVALRGRPLGEHFVNDLVWELVAGGLGERRSGLEDGAPRAPLEQPGRVRPLVDAVSRRCARQIHIGAGCCIAEHREASYRWSRARSRGSANAVQHDEPT
jgi:hypothetical protein